MSKLTYDNLPDEVREEFETYIAAMFPKAKLVDTTRRRMPLYVRFVHLKHWFGLHTYVPSTQRSIDGAWSYGGLSCFICGKKSGV